MSESVKTVNKFFREADKVSVNVLKAKMLLSDRQSIIFDMYYLRGNDVGFIADSLCVSGIVINRELYKIRKKIMPLIE